MKRSVGLSLLFVSILAVNVSAMEIPAVNSTSIVASVVDGAQGAPGLLGLCFDCVFSAVPYIGTARELYTAWQQEKTITSRDGLLYFSYSTIMPSITTEMLLAIPTQDKPINEWTFFKLNQETEERIQFVPVVDENHTLSPLMRPQTVGERCEAGSQVLMNFGATLGSLNIVQHIPMAGVSGFCLKAVCFVAVQPFIKKIGRNTIWLLGYMAKKAISCCHRQGHAHCE